MNLYVDKKLRNKIPEDLIEFLGTPRGRSLIIRGGPGTGKTTFALELTEQMRTHFNTHYISSRVGDMSLYDHFSWLKEQAIALNKSLIQSEVDVLTPPVPDSKKLEALKNPGELNAVNRTELDKLEARVEAGEEFLDYDEGAQEQPPPVFEDGKLTFDIAMILPEVDMVYDSIDRVLPKKSLIMIDSIEALSEKYGISSKKLIYTMQKDLVENSNTNVVFILEKTSSSELEFLADGVINMEVSEFEGRRIRTLNIQKLRGIHIRNPNILFSLLGGRFNALEMSRADEGKGGQEASVHNIYSEIENLAGGFRDSSINFFEFGGGTESSIIEWLFNEIIAESIQKGRGTYVLLPERMNMATLEKYLADKGLSEDKSKNLYFLQVAELGESMPSPNTIPIEGDDLISDFRWDRISHILSKNENHTFIAGFDTLNSIYGRYSYLSLVRHISTLRRKGGKFFGFGWSSDSDSRKFSSFAHTHLKFDSINGYQILYGERPYSGINCISLFDDGDGKTALSMTPLV